MTVVVAGEEWQPWYRRRLPPVFCVPCLPAYMGIWHGRHILLIIGFALFILGVMVIFSLLLTCLAMECDGLVGGLLPIGLILIIVGTLISHCAWAAHLLDESGHLPVKRTVTTTTTVRFPQEDEGERRLLETAYQEGRRPLNEGFWQFEEEASWQAVANPYPIQQTLKPCLERLPY